MSSLADLLRRLGAVAVLPFTEPAGSTSTTDLVSGQTLALPDGTFGVPGPFERMTAAYTGPIVMNQPMPLAMSSAQTTIIWWLRVPPTFGLSGGWGVTHEPTVPGQGSLPAEIWVTRHRLSGSTHRIESYAGADSSRSIQTSLLLSDGVWRMHTSTWDGQTHSYYVNDTLQTSAPWANTTPPNVVGIHFYQGQVDTGPLAVFNRALTPAEVSVIFHNTERAAQRQIEHLQRFGATRLVPLNDPPVGGTGSRFLPLTELVTNDTSADRVALNLYDTGPDTGQPGPFPDATALGSPTGVDIVQYHQNVWPPPTSGRGFVASSTNMTIAVWLRERRTGGSPTMGIFAWSLQYRPWQSTSANRYAYFGIAGNLLIAGAPDTGSQSTNVNMTTFPDSVRQQWHHYAASFNGSTVRVFRDGDLIATGPSLTNATDFDSWGIGYFEGGAAAWMQNGVDVGPIGMFARALSDGEIKTIATNPTLQAFDRHINSALALGAIGMWPMDDPAGSISARNLADPESPMVDRQPSATGQLTFGRDGPLGSTGVQIGTGSGSFMFTGATPPTDMNNRTWMAWIRSPGTPGAPDPFGFYGMGSFEWNEASTPGGTNIQYWRSTLHFNAQGSVGVIWADNGTQPFSPWFNAQVSSRIFNNQWAHWAIVVSGTTLRLYYNGEQIGTATVSIVQPQPSLWAQAKANTIRFILQGTTVGYNKYFVGPTAAFDRALTAQEIKDVYHPPISKVWRHGQWLEAPMSAFNGKTWQPAKVWDGTTWRVPVGARST